MPRTLNLKWERERGDLPKTNTKNLLALIKRGISIWRHRQRQYQEEPGVQQENQQSKPSHQHT